jgi:RNA polymerase sigma-70 factor (ECF subfamily)
MEESVTTSRRPSAAAPVALGRGLYLFRDCSVYHIVNAFTPLRVEERAMRTALSSPPSRDPGGIASVLDEDARLVVLAKRDRQAFAPLYARYFDLVYRYCYRRLGHPEAAADAAGQVFAKALAALPGYREEAPSFRSWLFAIAHNVITDDLRARRPVAPMDAAAHVAESGPSPEEVVLSDEASCLVRALLATLSPDQRQILELRLAGLTGPEIAAVLGRSLGSVKIAQVRAFARLREQLTPGSAPVQEGRER